MLECPSVAARLPHASTPVRRLGPVPRMQVLPRSPELLDERIVGPRINVVGGEDTRITSRRFDLGLEPLKVLTRIRRIGKRIDRLFQRNRADLLEPAPGRDSEVRGMRRELVDKQQPASTVGAAVAMGNRSAGACWVMCSAGIPHLIV